MSKSDSDLHHFIWRNLLDEPLKDFRKTHLTFGVSASPFIASMHVHETKCTGFYIGVSSSC